MYSIKGFWVVYLYCVAQCGLMAADSPLFARAVQTVSMPIWIQEVDLDR